MYRHLQFFNNSFKRLLTWVLYSFSFCHYLLLSQSICTSVTPSVEAVVYVWRQTHCLAVFGVKARTAAPSSNTAPTLRTSGWSTTASTASAPTHGSHRWDTVHSWCVSTNMGWATATLMLVVFLYIYLLHALITVQWNILPTTQTMWQSIIQHNSRGWVTTSDSHWQILWEQYISHLLLSAVTCLTNQKVSVLIIQQSRG